MNVVVVGAQWGDEGKGKMTDFLAKYSDIVIRFQGGNNAGHTILNDYGKFALHLLPSGIFYPNIVNILGQGVAVNISAFFNEINTIISKGVPIPIVKISDRAQIMMPYHILFDKYEEERLKDNKFGSTKSGIAPFYSDKYLKIGLQVSQLYDDSYLRGRVNQILEKKNIILKHLYNKNELNPDIILSKIFEYKEKLKPYLINTFEYLKKALDKNKNILVEGQLGALRDPDNGIYPFSTSSSTLAGYASVGSGIPPWQIKEIIAVVKAYSTCVGAGPFVTELFGNEATELRNKGGDAGEYGATTGRPRRVGWFDCVATRYGCLIQGATEVALTNLDVLGFLNEIPICTYYKINDKKISYFPTTTEVTKAKPVYKTFKGWNKDISNIREFSLLPQQAKDYISFIEDKVEVQIKWISIGPKRNQIIKKE